MLIGVCGLIGSGKDTVAKRLVKKHGFKRDSFAKSLKDAVGDIFNWDRKLLEGKTKKSREWREQPDKFWSEKMDKEVTPRWVLQYFGTEVMRKGMHDAIWVDSVISRYKGKNTVISDTRFQNEIKTIKAHGGKIICVKRNPIPSREWMEVHHYHLSEWDWIGAEFDYTIENNGTVDDLNLEVDSIIRQLRDPLKSSEVA